MSAYIHPRLYQLYIELRPYALKKASKVNSEHADAAN